LAASRGNATAILQDAEKAYKVDTDVVATKVKQEFAAKVKSKKAARPAVKVAKNSGPVTKGRRGPTGRLCSLH
jgi:ParB family transcriptional regulator, chromosome partitioning protein